MPLLQGLLLRLRSLRRRRLQRDLDDEMRFHMAMSVREKLDCGESAGQAVSEAAKDLGNLTSLREKSWELFTFGRLETFAKDVAYGARLLHRNAGFTLAAVATLALGIGANVGIFSVVKAVLLNSLPYPDAQKLVMLGESDSGEKRPETVGYTTAYDWRRLSNSFQSMSLYRDGGGALVEGGESEVLSGLRVNYDFFDTLGVPMKIGRGFLPEEDQPGNRLKLVLSYSLWMRKFGGDPSVLNRVIHLNNAAYTIVGVLSADLPTVQIPGSGGRPEIFSPLGYALTDPFACRDCQHLRLLGRLRSGVPLSKAQAEMDSIMADLVRQYPKSYPAAAKVSIQRLHDYTVGQVSTALWILLGAVGFVLLIACANVANLMVARAGERTREIALRAALGAGRSRLIRQLLTESLLLSLLGGLAGMLLALLSLRTLISLAPSAIPRIDDVRIDGPVIGLAFLVSILTGAVFGLVPALYVSRSDLNVALKNGGKASLRTHGYFSRVLVTSEVTLAFILVVGAVLMAQSFARLTNVDLGFDANRLLTFTSYVYGARYREPGAELNYYRSALEQLRALPDVAGAAMTSQLPLRDSDRYGFHIRDRRLTRDSEAPSVDTYSVSRNYFSVMKIPLKRGRFFQNNDLRDSPHVALISESCVRKYFPDRDPIGLQIQLGGRDETQPWITIAGVVGDVRQSGLGAVPGAAAYILQDQNLSFGFTFVVRTKVDPTSLERAIRAAIRSVDAALPIYRVQPMESYVESSLAPRRFTLRLLALFGCLALALAAVGVYGVISHGVTQQTREIGIRMALGASRRDVLAKVLWQGATLAFLGVALGLMFSLGLTRLLSNLLFDVHPMDQADTVGVAVLLAAVAVAASYLPARRASRVDPMAAIREE